MAVQLGEPLGPLLAVKVTEAPEPREVVSVSDQLTCVPSTQKLTPIIVPAGVAPVPWFFTTALKVTALPVTGLAGFQVISVTTKSGDPPSPNAKFVPAKAKKSRAAQIRKGNKNVLVFFSKNFYPYVLNIIFIQVVIQVVNILIYFYTTYN